MPNETIEVEHLGDISTSAVVVETRPMSFETLDNSFPDYDMVLASMNEHAVRQLSGFVG